MEKNKHYTPRRFPLQENPRLAAWALLQVPQGLHPQPPPRPPLAARVQCQAPQAPTQLLPRPAARSSTRTGEGLSLLLRLLLFGNSSSV
jgi:hypothetical protein